jgi:hypothetical protein
MFAINVGNIAFRFNDHRLRNLFERDRTSGERDPLQGAKGILAIMVSDAG